MQELSLNVLDIAQNSVRAQASLICIKVEEDPDMDRLAITIEDNGCGMTEEQAARVQDPFFTTRTTRKVGLGVPFFKMAAELTGGGLTIQSQPGKGTTVLATFGLSHIDRMPLGDISGTVAALIQCNPDIDFVYTRRIGQRSVTADTREFRKILGDIPLDTPEVSLFIREFLDENTAALAAESID
ncbi:MAG: ATP-binding protein [Angelakisella sp.]|nr:ATP-binding protein [Angelakisella sp.]